MDRMFFKYTVSLIWLTSIIIVAVSRKSYGVPLHKKADARTVIRGSNTSPFQTTRNVDDLVKNPTALNGDEANEINRLDSMSDAFMNPAVSSESQDLSRQGLDPYVAMQISKLDHSMQDILGPNRNRMTNAKTKGDIVPGYSELFNPDGSVSLSNTDWPEYQIRDTPGPRTHHQVNPGMLLNGKMMAPHHQVSPQAALNPNLLPGQKADLGEGMGVQLGGNPMMSKFADQDTDKTEPDKTLMSPAFQKPGIKSAGFRIPGAFAFKGEDEKKDAEEEANFVKNYMQGSKKSKTTSHH